jgi:hypothetical protein
LAVSYPQSVVRKGIHPHFGRAHIYRFNASASLYGRVRWGSISPENPLPGSGAVALDVGFPLFTSTDEFVVSFNSSS